MKACSGNFILKIKVRSDLLEKFIIGHELKHGNVYKETSLGKIL